MSESTGLTNQVKYMIVDHTRDYEQLLIELAVRLEPFNKELIRAWTQVYTELHGNQPLPSQGMLEEMQQEAQRVLLGSLRKGNIAQYYADVQDWALRTAHSGMPYDRVTQLVREYLKSCLPFIRRVWQMGPEFELILGAVDDLYTGIATLVGAAYIQAAQEQLVRGARVRSLGELTIGATHALNNLFASILGRTQLLSELVRDPELKTELGEIQRAAASGAQMVRRIQDYARTNSEVKFTETDVNALIRDAAEITRFVWRDQSEASGIVIDVVKDLGDVPPVLARADELKEVLVSLIMNSIEAMPRGGLITLRTERKGDNVLVSVTDTGEGMSEERKLLAVNRFFTSREPPHSGLGLSNAAEVVSRHQGVLTVESNLAHGTTISLTVPIAPERSELKPFSATPAERTIKILIIDDEPTVRDVIGKFLVHRGYQVHAAESGREGIAEFKKTTFDLVVTDLGMPGQSGWQVAREIKRLNPKTLVVLMSGWAADVDARKLNENGVDRIVHKPFNVDEVLGLVEEAEALKAKG